MALLDLTLYKPVPNTTSDANAISNAFTATETVVNALTNVNIDAAAAISISKLASYPSDATKFLRGDGTWATLTTYRKTTSKTVNTTVSPTDLLNGEITIGAGVMSTNKVARLTAWGDAKQNSGSADNPPRYQVIFGTTTVLDTGTSGNTNWANLATRAGWKIVVEILNLGAANSQMVFLSIDQAAPNVSGTGLPVTFTTGEGTWGSGNVNQPGTFIGRGWNTSAENTATAKALVVNVIHPNAHANTETKLTGALVEII